MKIAELEPVFLRIEEPGKLYKHVDTLEEAQGLHFLCPKCFVENAGRAHYVGCWFKHRGVSDEEVPGPGRWDVTGSGYADLSLSPSVHLTGPGCGWHGFITNGEVTSV